jgi:hypothetical protein
VDHVDVIRRLEVLVEIGSLACLVRRFAAGNREPDLGGELLRERDPGGALVDGRSGFSF